MIGKFVRKGYAYIVCTADKVEPDPVILHEYFNLVIIIRYLLLFTEIIYPLFCY